MRKSHFSATTALLMTVVLIASSPDSAASEADWHPVIACQYVVPDSARLACYDETVRQAAKPDTTALQNSKAPETLFGKSDADVRRELRIVPPSQLSAKITAVRRNGYKKLLITLNNGQRWRQLDNDYLRLSSGDEIVIERAMAGSYLLRKESGGRSIRVKRSNTATVTSDDITQ